MQPNHENKSLNVVPPKNVLTLSIKNFMQIREAKLELGKITQITGQNSQGKTSIIKAIQTAIKGSTDTSLITHGEERMEVVLELPDETHIRRTLNQKGNSSVSVDRGDFSVKAPQGYLAELFDYNGFNPIELLDSKGRNEAILKAIDIKITPELLAEKLGVEVKDLPDLDYSQHGLKVLDSAYRYKYQRRKEANADALAKKNKWSVNKEGLVIVEKPELDREKIAEQVMALNDKKKDLEAKKTAAKVAVDKNQKVETDISQWEQKKIELAAEADKLEADHDANLKKAAAEYERKVQELNSARSNAATRISTKIEEADNWIKELKEQHYEAMLDPNGFDAEIAEVANSIKSFDVEIEKIKTFEAAAASVKMVEDLEAEYKNAEDFASKLTNQLEQFEAIKAEILATAEMPIDGLTMQDGQFLVNGVAIENLSASQTMKLAVGIARKHAKKTKIICCDGLELLDEANYKAFMEEIQKDDFHYVITTCRGGDPAYGQVLEMKSGSVQ